MIEDKNRYSKVNQLKLFIVRERDKIKMIRDKM